MSTFDRRKEGFEKKFEIDEEQRFKAAVRLNRLLGLWSVKLLEITCDAAAAYANEVVAADFEEGSLLTSGQFKGQGRQQCAGQSVLRRHSRRTTVAPLLIMQAHR